MVVTRAAPLLGQQTWWRFGRYRIEGGYVRPDPHSRLATYDPWEIYGRTKGRGSESPIDSLLALCPRLGDATEAGARSNRDEAPGRTDKDVLRWVARYGLLGLGLERVFRVTVRSNRYRPDNPVLVSYVRDEYQRWQRVPMRAGGLLSRHGRGGGVERRGRAEGLGAF